MKKIWKNYEEYEENMNKSRIWSNMNEYEGNMKNYEENIYFRRLNFENFKFHLGFCVKLLRELFYVTSQNNLSLTVTEEQREKWKSL